MSTSAAVVTFKAINAAEATADPKWKAAAAQIVEDICLTNKTFTTDLVWHELAIRGLTTHEHRAMGPVMMNAVRAGMCEIETCNHCGTTKVMTKTLREEAHKMDVAVYRSLLFGDI